MITRMALQNFKGWEELPEAKFGKLTGFFGLNSAGKSSLIQLLLMLKQTVESSDRSLPLHLGDERDPRTLVDLGTFWDVIYAHDPERALSFTMGWRPRDAIKLKLPNKPRVSQTFESVDFSARVSLGPGSNLMVESFEYRLAESLAIGLERSDQKFKLTGDSDGLGLKKTQGRKWDLPSPTKCYGFPDRVRTDFQNPEMLLELERAFESFFIRDLYYLGPLRYQPQRSYTWGGARPEDVGHRGENVIAAILASRAEPRGALHAAHLEQKVAIWLKRLKLVRGFRLQELAENSNRYVVEVQTGLSSPWVSLTDVGFGVSQVLPVLTLCFYVPKGSTVILEHPEIHLHPAAQTGLADMILAAIRERGIQVIIESHSEHFLRRLQRRVAEGSVSSEDVKLYFCEEKYGSRKIELLKLNLFGEIENWPKDFFGDQLGEAIETQRAGLERMLKVDKE